MLWLVGAFNLEKALEEAFSMIVQVVVDLMDRFAALILNKYKWRQRRDPLLDLPHRLIVDKYFYPFTTDVRTIGNKLFITAVAYKTNKTNGYRKGHQGYLYNIGIL